jgi:hypothetical protein
VAATVSLLPQENGRTPSRPAPRLSTLEYVFDNIWIVCHATWVKWAVEMADEFEPEFDVLHEDVQTEILAVSLVLEEFGPRLGRPRDPKRRAILLAAGDKSGGSEKRLYRELIRSCSRGGSG